MVDVKSPAFQLAVKKELSRREFWEFCKLTAPDFYTEQRPFLRDLCETLQWFVTEAKEQIMVINMPPRHGKSRSATQLVKWIFGIYGPAAKVMTGSYNETLSSTFAKQVRDSIAARPTEGALVYNDIFPNTRIKYGSSAVQNWSLEGSEQSNYLATSPKGTATGFGCNIMIIDDLIKSAAEAYNERTLEEHKTWFTDTMLSRLENGFKIIIIMTRWATNDLAGFILSNYDNVVHINYKAVQDNGEMLCPDILTAADYALKTKNMNKEIVLANYQQEPIDIKGRLYSGFKTYTEIPADDQGRPLFEYVLNYTDTADTGSDFLCSICYGMYQGSYYILDVLYSKDAMEKTEPATAEMLTACNVGFALIESNNGGRGFARNVERLLQEMGNKHTAVRWFHQSQNKTARILSNSTGVMNNILLPVNWQDRWPEFAADIMKYQREGKNAHDDAPDALTGVYENDKPRGLVKLNRSIKGSI